MRKWFLVRFLVGLTLGGQLVSGRERPNMVLILADDLGYGDLQCYGKTSGCSTPHLDRLAASGVRMTQAYATPVCSPTRASVLTGRFPEKIGVFGNHDGANPGLGRGRESFVPRLQRAGYRCAWFGKWHQGWDLANHPLNNGFDVGYGFLGGMHDYVNPAKGDHPVGGPFATQALVFDGFKPAQEMKYLTEEVTDRAVGFIRDTRDQPFFLYLAYNAPHTPLQAPDDLLLPHLRAGVEPREAVYRAMVESLDAQVGRVFAVLEECGLQRDTLVVFVSDNGGASERHNGGLRGSKMTVWEGGIRVPMVASWRGRIPEGRVSESMCCMADLAATFQEVAGVTEHGGDQDGVNLLPYWCGLQAGNAHHALVWSIHVTGPPGARPTPENLSLFAVRKGGWKVVRDRQHHTDALYDLERDPAETRDLSGQEPLKKRELLEMGRKFLETCPPGSGQLAQQDTRVTGGREAERKMLQRCRELLSKKE
jgi:arylsulfatase A-like enzyme